MPSEPRRRHNGQLQACEPCRKAKIRCDHGSPKCSRCAMRSLNCVYHPAPMTKGRRSPASRGPACFEAMLHAELLTTPVTPTELRRPIEPLSSPEAPLPSNANRNSLASSGLSTCRNPTKRNTLFRKGDGRHETTRFSAVFFENEESFGSLILDPSNPSNSNHEPGRGLDGAARARLQLAVNTLLDFPTTRTCNMLISGLDHIYDVWMSPTMVRQCLNQVWTEYGDCLGDRRTRESVLRMANDLLVNDQRRPSTPDCDAESSFDRAGWMNWFSGPHLRWEMIGILFSWAGFAFRHRDEWDPVFDLPEQQGRNRNTAASKMRECAAACLRLCDDHFEISDIMVICMKNCSKLQSIIISDESDRIRVDYGTVGSAFITAGLHHLPPLDKVTPLSQHRSSIASSMYYLDKCESLFNARPPMLSRRYCQCPLPLDLCEDDVYGGRETLAAALERLDSNGWNTGGQIFTTTWLRALAILSPIREGILELSLSVNVQFTKPQVEDLITQLRQIVASYPPHIQFDRNSVWSSASTSSSHTRSPHDIFIITRIHLDVLQCHFLLQRLLVSRGFCGGQGLFDIAQETMSIILCLWLKRDQLQELNHTFDWIAVSYGMPCAGILCIELLRASHLVPPAPATESSTMGAIHLPAHFSRSEVVQNLTMFKALLDWIRPTDNNAQLSNTFKQVLQRILDNVFDSLGPLHDAQIQQLPNDDQHHRPYELQHQQPRRQNLSTTTNSQDYFDPAMTTMDDMNWLNNIDWTQGGWLERSNQPFLL